MPPLHESRERGKRTDRLRGNSPRKEGFFASWFACPFLGCLTTISARCRKRGSRSRLPRRLIGLAEGGKKKSCFFHLKKRGVFVNHPRNLFQTAAGSPAEKPCAAALFRESSKRENRSGENNEGAGMKKALGKNGRLRLLPAVRRKPQFRPPAPAGERGWEREVTPGLRHPRPASDSEGRL